MNAEQLKTFLDAMQANAKAERDALIQQMREDRETAQNQIRELLQQRLPGNEAAQINAQPNNIDQRLKNLSAMMTDFVYEPESNDIFETWYSRHESIITDEAADMTESQKIRLLLTKFSNQDYRKFADSILPKKPTELTVEEAIKLLKPMFG